MRGACRFDGEPRRGEVELRDQALHAVIRHRDGGGIEGVGLDDVRARFEILAVDAADQLGLRQHEQVIVAAQVARPVAKALAPELRLVQVLALDHGAHGAVEHQDALGEEGLQLRGTVAMRHGKPEKQNARSACAETGVWARLFSGICNAPAS